VTVPVPEGMHVEGSSGMRQEGQVMVFEDDVRGTAELHVTFTRSDSERVWEAVTGFLRRPLFR
jgi:hypothetical protein